ncbi:MAG: DNA pilot protein [Arizlama microvirus]|nr:MAG: DNA pilot protein [Arizlama microvirus]
MGIFGTLGAAAGTWFGMPQLGAAAGSLIDGLRSENAQDSLNAQTMAEAQKTRDFQERMRSTQYQTAVDDLQKAGLNPMLAYSQGGAGTPSGATSGPLQNKVATGAATARESANTMNTLQQTQTNAAQLDLLKAQTSKTQSETLSNAAATAIQAQELAARTAEADTATTTASLNRAAYQADLQKRQVAAQQAAQTYNRESETFNANVQKQKAESTLTQMEIPRAQSEAKFWNDSGTLNPWLRQIMMMLQAMNSAKSFGGK